MTNEELIEKCETCSMDPQSEVGAVCKTLLTNIKESDENVGASDTDINTYLGMVDSLKPKDLRYILQLALHIDASKDIKDTELKKNASILIRAIEKS